MSGMSKIRERAVLRAIFQSAQVVHEDVRWRHYAIDKSMLSIRLRALGGAEIAPEAEISDTLGLCVLRTDALKFSILGFERAFERQSIAEGMGSAGVQFFPTRQSVNRTAFEAAREAAYFGYGDISSQFLACPLDSIKRQVWPEERAVLPEAVLLRDLREGFSVSRSVCEVLSEDKYFPHAIDSLTTFATFQTQLRSAPLEGSLSEKLANFFNRRATIGIRDTIRWSLGSRHPWFDWKRANELIDEAFAKHAQDSFNTPQIVYYAYDPSIDEAEITKTEHSNANVVSSFTSDFRRRLEAISPQLSHELAPSLETLCTWILDIHHDYPDFDLESQGQLGTHIEFLGHSIQNKVSRDFFGTASQTRRNFNMRAHFDALGLDKTFLPKLDADAREQFFACLDDALRHYNDQGGITTADGIRIYHRLPTVLFLIQNMGKPNPRPNERLLDSFDLSRMTQLEHASYMRSFPEISEKLLVFFTLTMRHMIDTDHVPDLRPGDMVRDFLVLGLWGTRTPNIHVNLYVDAALDERDLAKSLTRAEVKFVGNEQVEIHPLHHLREEAKVLRFFVAQLSPLIEPSILRNIGTFTMAMEEFRSEQHGFTLDAFNITHYALDVLREAARYGIKGSVTDAMSLYEFLLDSTLDATQKRLSGIEKWLRKIKG